MMEEERIDDEARMKEERTDEEERREEGSEKGDAFDVEEGMNDDEVGQGDENYRDSSLEGTTEEEKYEEADWEMLNNGQYEKEKATDDLETDCRGGKLECEDRNH